MKLRPFFGIKAAARIIYRVLRIYPIITHRPLRFLGNYTAPRLQNARRSASAEARAMFMVSYPGTAIAVQLHLRHRRRLRSARFYRPGFHSARSRRHDYNAVMTSRDLRARRCDINFCVQSRESLRGRSSFGRKRKRRSGVKRNH